MRRVLFCLVLLAVGVGIGWLIPHGHTDSTIRDTIWKESVIVDTLPIVKDSSIVRVVTRYAKSVDTIREVVVVGDSVRIPIEQKHYADSSYEAWVSGYEPSLDSIKIKIREPTIIEKIPPKRWAVGIQGGVGLTPKGIQPYIGIGVSYRLK